MFSRKEQLLLKTGPDGIGRFDFLRLLKKEFFESNSEEAKGQILANLANFAYDPINYDYIRSLNIIDLFLQELNSTNIYFRKFSAAAICNLSADPINCQQIIQRNGVELFINLLSNSEEEVVLNIISALTFIQINIAIEDQKRIFNANFVDRIRNLKESNSSVRICNLATIFLDCQNVVSCVSRH